MQKYLIEGLRVLISLAIIGVGFAFMAWLGERPKPPKKEIIETLEMVETRRIELRNDGLSIDVDGVAVPYREIPVAAEVSGRITQMDDKVRAGKYVQQGDFLLQLDERDYKFEVQRLESEIKQAENSLKELEVDRENQKGLLELAKSDLELREGELVRVKNLQKKRAASASELDMAKRAVLQAKNAVAQVENQINAIDSRKDRLAAGVELKEVQLQRAKLDLTRARVTAPISGIVVDAPAEQDAYVQRGAPLLTIEDTSRVEVRCQLKLDELYWLLRQSTGAQSASEQLISAAIRPADYEIPHADAKVRLRIGDSRKPLRFEWDAELSRFEGIGLDERTRTIPCRVVVRNPRSARAINAANEKIDLPLGVQPPALIRGMFVDVEIQVPLNEPMLAIPDIAIQPGGTVWVFQPTSEPGEVGELRIVDVDIVRFTDDGNALVRPGGELRPNAEVVVSPLIAASNGMPVKKPSSSSSEADDKSEIDAE